MNIGKFCQHCNRFINSVQFYKQIMDHYLAVMQSQSASEDAEEAADARQTLAENGMDDLMWLSDIEVAPALVQNLIATMRTNENFLNLFLGIVTGETLEHGRFWDTSISLMVGLGVYRHSVFQLEMIDQNELDTKQRDRLKKDILQSRAASAMLGLQADEHLGLAKYIDEAVGAECTDVLVLYVLAYILRRSKKLYTAFCKLAE